MCQAELTKVWLLELTSESASEFTRSDRSDVYGSSKCGVAVQTAETQDAIMLIWSVNGTHWSVAATILCRTQDTSSSEGRIMF